MSYFTVSTKEPTDSGSKDKYSQLLECILEQSQSGFHGWGVDSWGGLCKNGFRERGTLSSPIHFALALKLI